ncbi:MAG: Ferrochelatase [Chlamydiales bacterium]|nr:Ferrochelatase [Chlamydiales bacterium]MCH9636197.1 Ferrochelatase [Chlamydiales bacterium]
MNDALIVANFGGPRSLKEVEPFLISLFTDREVFRSPAIFSPLFRQLAKKRSKSVVDDYAAIGGKSPIYEDTEYVAAALADALALPTFAFHRYLPATHAEFFKKIEASAAKRFLVFPMFPQFTYATTGSIAAFFEKHFPKKRGLRWIKSYPKHPAFVQLFQKMIRSYLKQNRLQEEETILLFSAHGLPQSFVDQGDVYQEECIDSFKAIKSAFPAANSLLGYQSKVGRAAWLTPSTDELCEALQAEGRRHVLFVPLTFTSDHVETLFEIEKAYMPLVRKRGLVAHRLEAPNRRKEWIEAIIQIINSESTLNNKMLLR